MENRVLDTSGGSADARRFPAKRPLVRSRSRAMSQQALAGKPSASQDDSSNVTPETTQARPPSSMSRPPIFSLRTHFIHGPCSTTMPRLCRPVRRIGTLFSRACLRRAAAPTGSQDVLGSSQPTSWSKDFWGGLVSPRTPERRPPVLFAALTETRAVMAAFTTLDVVMRV